jgi:ATP-dependent RNA helicase DDX47/RRP3
MSDHVPSKKKKKKKSKKSTEKSNPPDEGSSPRKDVVAEPITPVVEQDSKMDEPKTWAQLGCSEAVQEACKELGWTTPTPIQKECLPYALSGRDVIGLAQTGSGKTAAFCIPVVEALLKNPSTHFALILAPTRELCFQISEQVDAIGAKVGVTSVVVVGGVDMIQQQIALMKKPHVIVATPGRMVDHLERTKGFHLRNLKFFVMDEADRLLNMDFEKELNKILSVIPRERNTFLFSATMTSRVGKLQRASLVDPVRVEVAGKYSTVDGLKQYYNFVPAKFKDVTLAFILNLFSGKLSIIFVSTCDSARRVAIVLRTLGFGALPLHGKMTQPQRLGSLNKFKSFSSSSSDPSSRNSKVNILIATDVASRGLDIPMVDLVINYDVPTHSKDYIHRVGRTARAGKSGIAINLVTQYDVEIFQRIEELIQKKLPEFKPASNQKDVLVFLNRVSEAQRIAALEVREQDESKDRKRKRPYGNDTRGEGRSGGGRGGSRGGGGGGGQRRRR